MVDSQATKNTCNAEGFCVYKCINGIKRHLAVDSLGFPFFTHCTKASVTDDQGLIEMFTENIDYFKAKPMNIPKITILVDDGYHPKKTMEELEKIYPKIMSKIKSEQSPKLTKAEKTAAGKSGFVPLKMRWIVERSNAWVERCKILVKNYERTLFNLLGKFPARWGGFRLTFRNE
ncbi:transposase family protein [Synechococcus sp. PCC 7502]|nr:transposase family protein [Synechococcus sp. PCC 7502]